MNRAEINLNVPELYKEIPGNFGIYSYYPDSKKQGPKMVSLKTIMERVENRNKSK